MELECSDLLFGELRAEETALELTDEEPEE